MSIALKVPAGKVYRLHRGGYVGFAPLPKIYETPAEAADDLRDAQRDHQYAFVTRVKKGDSLFSLVPDASMENWYMVAYHDAGMEDAGRTRTRKGTRATPATPVPSVAAPTTAPVATAVPTSSIGTSLTPEQFTAAENQWNDRISTPRRRTILSKFGIEASMASSGFSSFTARVQEDIAHEIIPDMFAAAERHGETTVEERKVNGVTTQEIPAATVSLTVSERMHKYIPKTAPYYVPQTIGSTRMEDLDILRRAVINKKNILLTGETGLGKTTAMQRVASELKLPYRSINLNGGITVEDLVGQWTPSPTGGFEFRDGILTEFVKWGGLLVAEEINSANPEVLFVLHSVLDDTRGLTLTAMGGKFLTVGGGEDGSTPELYHFCFAATMNPSYSGTQELNLALRDRFQVVLEFEGKNIPLIIKNPKLVDLYDKLHSKIVDGSIAGIVSLRGLKQFMQNESIFGEAIAKELFLQKFFTAKDRELVQEIMDTVGL